MNDSTKFISPTKVLEYMAAEKLSVSTPITDVKVPYGDVVAIAETPEEFIAACERMLNATAEQKAALAERMRAIVANTSWDKTAAAMHHLIQTTEPANKAQRLTADEYIAACERMLALDESEKARLVERMRDVVANTSWDKTAGRMHELISTTAPGETRSAAAAALEAGTAARVSPLPVAQKSAA